MKFCLIHATLLFLIFLSSTQANAEIPTEILEDEPTITTTDLSSHTIGFKLSSISFSGLAYTARISEQLYVQMGGFFTYDSDRIETEYRYQLGLEFQRTLTEIAGFSVQYIIGGSFDQQYEEYASISNSQKWIQIGTGLSLRNVSPSGLTVHFDGGFLRYRATSGSNDRNTLGIGGGFSLGYSF